VSAFALQVLGKVGPPISGKWTDGKVSLTYSSANLSLIQWNSTENYRSFARNIKAMRFLGDGISELFSDLDIIPRLSL
jgi:hypothetical protein